VRLPFDQNPSRRLVAMLLAEEFPESSLVALAGLDTATDRPVWEWPNADGDVVVSKGL
jgi:Domain of unknown function (DUF5615)